MLVILGTLVYLLDPDGWTLEERRGEEKRNEVTLETHDKVRISLAQELTRAFFDVHRSASSSYLLGGTRAGAIPNMASV